MSRLHSMTSRKLQKHWWKTWQNKKQISRLHLITPKKSLQNFFCFAWYFVQQVMSVAGCKLLMCQRTVDLVSKLCHKWWRYADSWGPALWHINNKVNSPLAVIRSVCKNMSPQFDFIYITLTFTGGKNLDTKILNGHNT